MSYLNAEIDKALKKYTSLQKCILEGKPILTGIFMAHEPNSGLEIEPYEIIISFPANYPYNLPTVWETGGKIKRHLMHDRSLCFGNWQDVESLCKNGVSLQKFFETVLNPHLCREFACDKTGEYLDGERSHGIEGIWEGYYEIFQTKNHTQILHDLEMVVNNIHTNRNEVCFCGSGKKFKKCHQHIAQQVLQPGRERVLFFLERLKTNNTTT